MRHRFSARLAVFTAAVGLAMPGAVRAASLAYITNADANMVSVIDTNTNTVIKTITGFQHPVAISINPAGTRVYVTNMGGSQATVSAINTQTNAISANIPIPALFATLLYGVAVNPVQNRAYATVGPDKVQVINTSTNSVTAAITVTVGSGSVAAAAVNPAGTTVYATTTDATVSVIDTTTNTETTTIAGGGEGAIVVHPNGTLAYSMIRSASYMPLDTVAVLDTATNTVSTTIPVGPSCLGVQGVALNPAGTFLYVTCGNTNNVVVIDTSTNTVVTPIAVGFVPDGTSVTPDGSRVYVANAGDNTVSVINTATNTVVDTIPVEDEPHSSFGAFIGPNFVCGNGTLEPGEGCDDGNLIGEDGCTSTCKIEQDWVVLPLKPLTLKIPAGATSVTKAVKVKVRNANAGPQVTPPLTTVQVIPNTSCTGFLYHYLDFGTGANSNANVAPGETATGILSITAPSAQFSPFNLKAPTRCTFTLTAYPTKDFTDEKNESNDVAVLEVNVINANTPEMTATHETTIASLKPLKVKIGAGRTEVTKTLKLKVGNADYLPTAEDPGAHSIAVPALDGDCPTATVGAVTLDGAASVGVQGGKTAKGVAPLTLSAAALDSPSALSPARCRLTLTALGPAGDTDASNNSTQLVIDVIDANDLP